MTTAIVRELADREAIRSLKFFYARCADAVDVDGMLSVFTDDCVVNFRADRSDERRGREAARDFFATAQSVVVSSSHHLSNMDIVFHGLDRAAMHSVLYSWQRFTGYPDVADRHRWARYEDVFVRTADGWRQSELLCLVAGEIGGPTEPRLGEVLAAPTWPGRSWPAPTWTAATWTGTERP